MYNVKCAFGWWMKWKNSEPWIYLPHYLMHVKYSPRIIFPFVTLCSQSSKDFYYISLYQHHIVCSRLIWLFFSFIFVLKIMSALWISWKTSSLGNFLLLCCFDCAPVLFIIFFQTVFVHLCELFRSLRMQSKECCCLKTPLHASRKQDQEKGKHLEKSLVKKYKIESSLMIQAKSNGIRYFFDENWNLMR